MLPTGTLAAALYVPLGNIVKAGNVTKTRTVSRRPRIARAKPTKRAAERIRESARDLFYRQGIRAVGVEEIVTRAGVTKPSLYRAFPSKDDLVADYLRQMGEEGLARFDAVIAARPDAPQRQLHVWLEDLLRKANRRDYRGCGTTNAVVEYPDPKHPARQVAAVIKGRFREKLIALAHTMGAAKPDALGDALLLLLEGVYASGQMFGARGPARVVIDAADALIAAATAKKRA
jgi:AcrR family transcriptional regulator